MVFGASGRTGRLVVEQARRRAVAVTAVVRRSPEPPFADDVFVVEIDVRDPAAIAGALEEADAVVSALGPIAGVTKTEISEATGAIVAAMTEHGPRRLVITANSTIFTDREVTGEYANVAAEHRRNTALLRDSALDWTIVVAPFLVDEPATGDVETVVDGKARERTLTRGDYAATLLDALDQSGWIRHAVGAANRPATEPP